ncbi:hypothetical protein [Arthrobacter sp. PAMC 25486]|uniref:hypothetical protein n=1 Tax=Arthrobacter sp. PAMC 25486 TaxID=1494608 RepID=UPI000570B096|nr:hypothetical protein [Arthrobacter sp. PAMC 25486]
MTKLIAALAILAALAWAVTAAASWIAKKKAPLALAAGKGSSHATAAEQDKSMLRAQWRTVAAIVFAAIMFAALFRISIGLSGQAGLPIAMTTGLSASGGLLLFSALPAAQLTNANPAAKTPLLPRRAFILPAATLAIFTAFVIATELAPDFTAVKTDGVPLLLVAVAFAGSALLVLHRLATTAMLADPRMAALDLRWREISARNVLNFASGALLAGLGTAAILAALALNAVPAGAAAAPSPHWATACAGGGVAVALAGVVLLALAAKGALTIRTRAREGALAPVTA